MPIKFGFADPTPIIGHHWRDRGDLIEDEVPILDRGNGSRLKHNYRLPGPPSAQVTRSNAHCVRRTRAQRSSMAVPLTPSRRGCRCRRGSTRQLERMPPRQIVIVAVPDHSHAGPAHHAIMAGKALPSMLVGIVQATLVLLVAQLWFRIPFAGSFFTLYAGLSLFVLAAIGIGLLLSSVAATMQQAMLFSFLLIMPFSLLSGLTTPISSMPAILQYLTYINPLRYAIDIAHRVYLEGAGLGLLIPELLPLAIIAAVTLPIASWMFRHRLA